MHPHTHAHLLQGAFFIDRDPKHFPSVLAYLRDGVCTLPESHSDKLELMRDAQFYGVSSRCQLGSGLMASLK